jgi:hypothetical protein
VVQYCVTTGGRAAQEVIILPLPSVEGATYRRPCGLAYWTGEAGDPAAARDQSIALLPVREQVLSAEHPSTLAAHAGLAYWSAQAE